MDGVGGGGGAGRTSEAKQLKHASLQYMNRKTNV